jgi:hypothetical protein
MLNGQPRLRVDIGEIPEYNLEELHLPSGVVEKGGIEKATEAAERFLKATEAADKLLSLYINWHQPLKEKIWLH